MNQRRPRNGRQRALALLYAPIAPRGTRAHTTAMALLPQALHQRVIKALNQLPPQPPINWHQGAAMPPAHLPTAPTAPRRPATIVTWGALAAQGIAFGWGCAVWALTTHLSGPVMVCLCVAASGAAIALMGAAASITAKRLRTARHYWGRT